MENIYLIGMIFNSAYSDFSGFLLAVRFDEANEDFDYFMWNISLINLTKNTIENNFESKLSINDTCKLATFSKIDYLKTEQINTPVVEQKTLLTLKDKNLVFFGDSIVNGQGAVPYSSRLLQLLELKTSTKQGYSGGTITQHNNNLCLVDKIKAFDFTNYDYCLIQVGTNDLSYNAELGTLETYETTYDNTKFYDSYREALDYILSNNANIQIILITPLQRYRYQGFTPIKKNTVNLDLRDYVEAIKKIGAFYSLPVIDMFSNCGLNYNTNTLLTSDGLHPNDEGYEKITLYLAKQLLSL